MAVCMADSHCCFIISYNESHNKFAQALMALNQLELIKKNTIVSCTNQIIITVQFVFLYH